EPDTWDHRVLDRDTDPSRRKPIPTRACREEDTGPVGDCREDARSRKATFLPDGGEEDDGETLACGLVVVGRGNSQRCGAPRRVSARQPRVAAPRAAQNLPKRRIAAYFNAYAWPAVDPLVDLLEHTKSRTRASAPPTSPAPRRGRPVAAMRC